MKSLNSIPALAFLFVLLASCSDDEAIKVQNNYNDNEMISILNVMSVEIDSLELKGDLERDFAKLLTIHHQGAIDMGMKQIAKGDDAALKIMAKEMVDMQQSEMDKLDFFLVEHNVKSSPQGYHWDDEAEASMTRMNNDAAIQGTTGDADNDYAALLIHHHRAANELAQSFLQHSDQSELNEIASKMIEDQNIRIEQLQNWLLQNKPQ
ncbi:MAG: DUF305 domain-containing protein [Chryseolinea sp.]